MKSVAIALAAAPLAVFAASTASAQWTRVEEVPIADIYNVWANGDTIAAASDSTAFVSLGAGATWIPTAKVASGVTRVEAVRLHNGRLYAGTSGQGVFVSRDMGATWQPFSQGLAGGVNNAHLYTLDMLVRGDTLYDATAGAGVWIRDLASAGSWSHYGNGLEPAQAGIVEGVAASSTRLLAAGGGNGTVYYLDDGQSDWKESSLENGGTTAGLAPLAAMWTGHSWLVGTNIGAFHSALGQEPWTYTDFGLRPIFFMSFALRNDVVFVHFANNEGTGIEFSTDDGVTWEVLDRLPLTFTYSIATVGDMLYAGRVDGLWRRSIANVSVLLADLRAEAHGNSVALSWRLDDPRPLALVKVQRSDTRLGPFLACSVDLVPVSGTMVFTDTEVRSGQTYWYRVVLIGEDGKQSFAGPIQVTVLDAQVQTALSPPIVADDGETIVIRYRIGSAGTTVALQAYDVRGRLLSTLEQAAPRAPGEYVRVWDRTNVEGRRLPRGVYFIGLSDGGMRLSQKLVLTAP
jgi:hypothetical protein